MFTNKLVKIRHAGFYVKQCVVALKRRKYPKYNLNTTINIKPHEGNKHALELDHSTFYLMID